MAAATGQDSNLTSVRYAVESSIGVLPGTDGDAAVWKLTEPNSEPDFGGNITTMERNPISADRQSIKGSVVDVEAGVSITQDFTLDNQMELLQGFMFAQLGGKGQVAAITGVTASDDTFARGAGLAIFATGDLVFARGFTEPANNGLHLVVTASATALVVGSALADETPPAGATLTKVGHQYGSADVTVDASGPRPKLVSAASDFDQLDLRPGESVYIGGDAVANQYATAANNGMKRVFLVDDDELTLDKSHLDMVTDASATGKSIRIFVGFSLKNEQGTGFVRETYQFERTLGFPDDSQPTQIQSEYVVGCVASEYALEAQPASKMTSTMTFMGLDHETRAGSVGVKDGARPDLPDGDAINTSSDPRRFRICQVSTTDEAPAELFAFVESMQLNINNNIGRNLALGTLGAVNMTTGRFAVTGNVNAYFADVAALAAVRANADVTLDMAVVSGNKGFAIDMPLMTLSAGRAVVESDQAIMMPCDFVAHSGAKVHASLDHTLCWTFFPYLPTLAQTTP